MKAPVRLLIPGDAHDAESFRLALGYAQKICETAGTQDVILLTHTKQQLDHTSLAWFLAPAAVRALIRGR